LGLFKKKTFVVKDNKQQQLTKSANTKQQPAPAFATQMKEPPIINKKEAQPMAISDKLVTNMLSNSKSGIWEYPPLALLADAPGNKADRGDIKKTANVIEKTFWQ